MHLEWMDKIMETPTIRCTQEKEKKKQLATESVSLYYHFVSAALCQMLFEV